MADPNTGDTRRNPATGAVEVWNGDTWQTATPSTPAGPAAAVPGTVDDTGLGSGKVEFREGPGGRQIIVGHDLFGNETYEGNYDPSKDGAGAGRNDALSAASSALSSFLQAQSLADARRMSAFDQFEKLSSFALPKGATTAPGYEPGGPAHAFAASIGLPQYTPPPITPMHVDPQALVGPAQIPPEVLAMIQNIRSAGGAG